MFRVEFFAHLAAVLRDLRGKAFDLMQILILGRGKTGSLVAEVARERGHACASRVARRTMPHCAALTAEKLREVDVVIDFTTPSCVASTYRCLRRAGKNMVVGTTGWYGEIGAHSEIGRKPRYRISLRRKFLRRRESVFRRCPNRRRRFAARYSGQSSSAIMPKERRALGHRDRHPASNRRRGAGERSRNHFLPRRRRRGHARGRARIRR